VRGNVAILTEKEYDLVIIGGGIFGACTAWDAALRGLSVALVEQGDFCQATSANHFRMVHGGIRYLQHADVPRIREDRNFLSSVHLRLVPSPSASIDQGSACRAPQALTGTLQLLRCEWQLQQYDATCRSDKAVLVQVAASS
jgi:glycerol-3-phosphate dehydrogenase